MPRTPRTLQVVLAERLAHLSSTAWDVVTRDAGVFLRRPFLSAFERVRPGNVDPRYALLYREDEPVAALCLQLVRVQGRTAVARDTPLAGVAQLVDERALVLGNVAGWGDTGLWVREGADAREVWQETLRLLDGLRRAEKTHGHVNVALVKDVGPVVHEGTLRRQGYQRAPSGADMTFVPDPAWRSLDDYLASLASGPRRAVKKTLREVESAGYRVRTLGVAELAGHEARLDALYGQVWDNADVRPTRLSGRFFAELKRELGDDCAVTALEKDGRLDAFGVCLRSGDACVGYYLGFDKSVDAPLYLRLLVSVIEQALAWRSVTVSMGRTAEEPKARLGAVAGPSSLWVKHRVPPINWAVSTVLGGWHEAPVPTHRVFKQRDEGEAGVPAPT